MNILIIGATRGIGLRLLEPALKKEQAVTALARDPSRLPLRIPFCHASRAGTFSQMPFRTRARK